MRRRKGGYFERPPGSPGPLRLSVKRRVRFSEVDPMGIVWFGRYTTYFEEAAAELGRACGLSYSDLLRANLATPIVQLHIDYFQPVILDEEITVTASLVWNEGSRLNTEFELKRSDGTTAATGSTVQMFVNMPSGEVCLVSPEILDECRRRWKSGEFACST